MESKAPVTFGGFTTDSEWQRPHWKIFVQHWRFSYDNLSVEKSIDLWRSGLLPEYSRKNTSYLLYNEPLSLVSGIRHAAGPLIGISVLRRGDGYIFKIDAVNTEYFWSPHLKKQKSAAGLFMADYAAADTVISQCLAFMEMGEK